MDVVKAGMIFSEAWMPVHESVLVFIIQDGRILLIEKKRGLGAGKVNGPGGKLDEGETHLEAAFRETKEEVGVTPGKLEEMGLLSFEFADGYRLRCRVYRAGGYEGELMETDEAKPFWVSLKEIPYDRMWEDDIHWFPHLLERRYFEGEFLFEGDRMQQSVVRAGQRRG